MEGKIRKRERGEIGKRKGRVGGEGRDTHMTLDRPKRKGDKKEE